MSVDDEQRHARLHHDELDRMARAGVYPSSDAVCQQQPRAHTAGGIVVEVAAADRMLELERQRDVLAEALVDVADAGCSGFARSGCADNAVDRGDWCDECTAADALRRAGLR